MRVYECATCGETHHSSLRAMLCCDPAAQDEND